MTQNATGIDAILSSLRAKRESLTKAAAAKTAERGTTSHPVEKQDNNTGEAATGARAAENTSDSKAQNPLNPDTAGSAAASAPLAGSQGVDAKDATQGAADKPKTTGVSDMANTDTTHPTKSARELLSERVKAARAGCGGKDGELPKQQTKVEGEPKTPAIAGNDPKHEAGETKAEEKAEHKEAAAKEAAEKEAAEKFASYCESLVKDYPDEFAAGCKFAMEVLEAVVQAANTKKAGLDPAMTGGDPAMGGDPAAMGGGAPAAGGDELEQLAAELEAAGVTPEELAQALQAEAADPAAPAGAEDQAQVAALDEALAAEGMSPEDLAAAIGGGGGDAAAGAAPAEDPAAAMAGAADKAAADKHAALVNQLRAQIRTIKAAKAQAKK